MTDDAAKKKEKPMTFARKSYPTYDFQTNHALNFTHVRH